jgi:hypothetical protein
MKNPFKPNRSAQDRDNPVVPNVVERPVERAADRAAMRDNPLVPNAIERPVERAAADGRGAVVNRPGIVEAVEQADALVSQVVTRLTEMFTRERSMLERQWTKGDNVSTEDLRIALTRYRSFFHRLLSM